MPDKPFEVDAKIHYVGGAGIGPELFISDETEFDDNRPIDKLHELAWVMSDKMPGIRLPDQTVSTKRWRWVRCRPGKLRRSTLR